MLRPAAGAESELGGADALLLLLDPSFCVRIMARVFGIAERRAQESDRGRRELAAECVESRLPPLMGLAQRQRMLLTVQYGACRSKEANHRRISERGLRRALQLASQRHTSRRGKPTLATR